jgi:N-acyl-D-amino-acid deacylase
MQGKEEFDVLILNGRVIDGSGNPWFYGDVGIRNHRIEAIGKLGKLRAVQIIDAKGFTVCPGFIDTHTHSDLLLFSNPLHEQAINQGITTEVVGQDGRSCAPITSESSKKIRDYYSRWGFDDWSWSSMAEYRGCYNKTVAINTVHLVGYDTVRLAIMGATDRLASKEELEGMKLLTARAMDEGAVGLSTALSGFPVDTDQIVELCKVVAEHGGVYVTHRRQQFNPIHFGGLREAIYIGWKAGVPVHVSHFKCGHGHHTTRGRSKEMLAMVEDARASGVDITIESYPYIAGCSGLISLLPKWINKDELDETLEKLRDPGVRKKMREEIDKRDEVPISGGVHGWPDWESSYIAAAASDKNKPLEGKSISEVSQLVNKDPLDAVCDLLIEEKLSVQIVHFGTHDQEARKIMEEDMRNIMQYHAHMVGSDSINIGSKPHPRAYGTYPRYIGRYCRELRILRLEDTIRKMTSLPAQRFNLHDRGLLKEGLIADIVILSPETILDIADYIEPRKFTIGIDYVIVNGQIVLEKGQSTGALPGTALP